MVSATCDSSPLLLSTREPDAGLSGLQKACKTQAGEAPYTLNKTKEVSSEKERNEGRLVTVSQYVINYWVASGERG